MEVKLINIDGCDNLRELGGYQTQDGKTVKYGQFYRGGALFNLKKPEAVAEFEKLGIKTILDLRSEGERKEAPDPCIKNAKNIAISALVAMDGSQINFDLKTLLTGGSENMREATQFVCEGYRHMPFNSEAYKTMFKLLLEEQVPIMFHCTAGKDRTGIAAALILTTLGVPFEMVIQDYMLTNKMREKSLEKMIEKFSPLLKNVEPDADVKAVFTQIAGVEEENLRVTFDEIYKKYKTFDEYLYSEFAIDDNARNILRRKYLQ